MNFHKKSLFFIKFTKIHYFTLFYIPEDDYILLYYNLFQNTFLQNFIILSKFHKIYKNSSFFEIFTIS